jgi:hypothetical protein
MKTKSKIFSLILLLSMGLLFQSCTIVGGVYGTVRGFKNTKAQKANPPVDTQVALEALDTIEIGTKLEVLLKDGRFFKGRFQDYTMVEFPNIAPYNELTLKKQRKLVKIKTDKIHEIVIPAKKKIKSPLVLGLAGAAAGFAADFIVFGIVYTIVNSTI